MGGTLIRPKPSVGAIYAAVAERHGVFASASELDERFRAALTEAIEGLPERERMVMSLYYDDELNLKEIGAVLKVSESRICQIHGQALTRLQARLSGWRDRL